MTTHDNLVDSSWQEAFIVELRLRDVDGRTIGDALAQVRSHCAESGQTMREAFGEPESYARSLELPAQPSSGVGLVIARSAIGLVAMFLTLWSFTAWLDGEGFTLTIGRIVALALLTGAVLLIARGLGFIVRHPWWSSLIMGALVAGVVVAEVVLPQQLVVLPALVTGAVGVAALLATSVWEARSSATDDDPVVDPVSDQDEHSGRAGRVLLALTPWVLPIATAAVLLGAWLMHQLV
ncbi:hypothetical protein [Agrococcus sp. Marseille-P2731]|uniref:hypothetical protein n=1 Tax=Agrococcus sp. Marseille-P2731 TaxID=1841862 RepID=UPI000931F829|nr:hypothetical protein [Agrococcus sp. Marseille-P2731]